MRVQFFLKKAQSAAKRKLLQLSLSLIVGGFVTLACATGAQAQIINPFGVNNGNTLTQGDFSAGRTAIDKLLDETATVGSYEKWHNPKSGNRGTLTLMKVFTSKSMPCRNVKSEIVYAKKGSAPASFVLDVCKIPSGEWKVVS